jgi:hypothetical protein
MSGVLNKPRLEAYVGSTGSGKGVSINKRLDALKPPRLIVWDPRDEYGRHAARYDSLPGLLGAVKHAKGGKVRARYVPGASMKLEDAFAFVCKLAFSAGDLVFLAEELSDVTKPSYAPPAWRQVVTQGRHKALHVIGAAQRPALLDKSFLGACTYIRTFMLRYDEDRKAMAKTLDAPKQWLDGLQTVENEAKGTTVINFIERDFSSGGKAQPGSITLRRKA